jgi:tetratricopeptide (TPR) repeat protein
MSLAVGAVVAERFEIVRLAGSGGMGRVYEARDLHTGASAALKVMDDRAAPGPERFVREARVLASLRHPGVVRYIAHGVTAEDEPYLVMEWLEGETLSQRLRASKLTVAESVALAKRIAAALGAVHRAGIVHRDLKPSNVFLVGRAIERAKLMDFGVARTRGPRLTADGMLVGTPGYMAPEQVSGDTIIDARADVFALGCVLFRCLAGRDAFATRGDLESVVLRVVLADTPRIEELGADVPAELGALLARMLAKRREDRPRDGDAALAELDALDTPTSGAKSRRSVEIATPPRGVLLGKPTAFVGRERELAMLEAAFAHATEYSAAGAVLVVGAPGAGKSRLGSELRRALDERGEPHEVWAGHGDPLGTGAAFGVLSRALRHALGIADGDPMEARRAAIQRRTARLPDAARVAAFVGELTGAPFPDDASAQLAAARRDPVLMGDQMRRAAEDLLRAACAERPVLLVLEDLHWSDLPTVTFVDAALRNLADLPLVVLALARPEVHAVFPQIWSERSTQVVRLGALPRRAAERLARRALGNAGTAERVAAIVDRAEGNAFYLEELIRAVAAGRDVDRHETARAIVEARLARLDPDARRVLAAASVLGRTFDRGGVEALLDSTPIAHALADLTASEVIERRDDEGELRFRHALVRDAAYAMLDEAARARGHRLAGEWLEREGKGEAAAIAEHFERGGDPARAAGHYLRAAEHALWGNDLTAAIDLAGRARACEAGAGELGEPLLIQAEAHLWRGELARAEELARAAAALLVPGSSAWFHAIAEAVIAAGKLGASDRVAADIEALGDALPGAEGALVFCASHCAMQIMLAGRYADADALLARVAALADALGEADMKAVAQYHQTRAIRAIEAGDPGTCLEALEASLVAFERAGDRRDACASRTNLGYLFTELGAYARAEATLRPALADAERMGLADAALSALQNLALAAAGLGRLDEARQWQEQACDGFQRLGDPRMEAHCRRYLALVALAAGDAVTAEREAARGVELLAVAPRLRAATLAVLARARLVLGRVGEARAAADEAMIILESAGGSLEEGEAFLRLVHADLLAAAGEADAAASALALARERLLARAARITDPALRASFLERVPENAATLAGAGC